MKPNKKLRTVAFSIGVLFSLTLAINLFGLKYNDTLSSKAVAKKVVVLDAGHDSTHTGATRNGLREEVLADKITQATYTELKKYDNVEVYLTHQGTSCPTPGSSLSACLSSRSQFAKSKNADLFVSLHINSTGAPSQTSASGGLVYISNYSKYYESSKRLTSYILNAYSARIGLPTTGAWTNADDHNNGKYDDGRWKDDLSVIRNNVLYGIEPILIEHAFINNPNDRAVLQNDSKLYQMGVANAEGIAKYLGLSKNSWNIAGLKASVSGSKVSLSPSISGSTSNLKYKYVYNKYNYNTGKYDWSKWGVIRPLSSTPSATWTAPTDGKYQIILDVEDNNGTVKSYSTEVDITPWTFTYHGVNAPSTIPLGSNTNISANVTGSTSGLKYKFVWSYNNWQEWGIINQSTTSKSVSFAPNKVGKYNFIIDIITPSGNILSKSTSSNVTNSTVIASVSAPPSAKVGQAITIKPNVSGSTSGVQYKYVWDLNSWSDWGVIKDMSSANSMSFTPKKPGTYRVHVDVKAPNGQITTKYATINVTENTITGVSVPSSAQTGTTVTIKPVVESTNGMQFKYVWSYNNWEKWGVISDFSSAASAKYTVRHPGKYDFIIDAKAPSGQITTKSAPTYTSLPWKATSLNLSNSSVKVNTPVKITGSSSGGSGLKYKFVWCYNNWQEWGVISYPSNNSSTSFTPKKSGKYRIIMDVIDSYENVSTLSADLTVK